MHAEQGILRIRHWYLEGFLHGHDQAEQARRCTYTQDSICDIQQRPSSYS
jgi:hypothetical protein